MQIVNLNAHDIMRAAHISGVINGVKMVQLRNNQVANRRVADMDDFAMNYLGAMAEVAVGKVLGVAPREDVTVYGDGGIDMVIADIKLQIKNQSIPSLKQRYAYLNTLDEFKADMLILCSVQGVASIGIHGFISKAKFFKHHEALDFGYGKRVGVKADLLAPIDKFYEAAEAIKRAA